MASFLRLGSACVCVCVCVTQKDKCNCVLVFTMGLVLLYGLVFALKE